MGKKRNTLGTLGSPLTNDLSGGDPSIDNITRAAQGSSLYRENSGASDVGGRMQEAGFANGYFNGKILGFDTGEVTDGYTRMGPSSFNPFSNNNDYEKIRKDNQSSAAAYTNMLGQFVAKTALNTAGGVIGSFYGLGSGLINFDASKIVDNSFLRGIDEASEKVNELAPVFTSQSDKDKGAFGIFSGLETVKSVSDAFSFTAGAVITEAVMQTIGNAVTAGGAEAGLPARLARYAAKMGSFLGEEKAIGRTLIKGGEYIGVGDKLKRIGEKANLASALLKDIDNPATMAIIEKAAMKEGLSLAQMKSYMTMSQNFDNTMSGIRKVMSGSLYEGALEGRQARDTMMANAEMTIEAQLNSEGFIGEKRDSEKEKRLAASEREADRLMLLTTAANVGLLSVSNAVQFPTLFGMKSFPSTKGLNNMSSLITRKTVEEAAKEVGQKGIAKAAGKAIGILEHPFQEFMEESLQGVISKTAVNYHDRLSNVRSQTAGLEHPTSEFMSSFGKGFTDQFTSKEGIEEGLIGAIVGGLGAPSFKRNAKGKIRPTIEGGILESIKGRSKEEKARIQDALDVINSDNTFQALKYNIEQTKSNSLTKNEKDKSIDNDDDIAFESAGTDEVFQHVANYLDKGLQDHLEEETASLQNMSPEEYTLKTRGQGAETISKDEMDKELGDYTRKVDTYKSAYEKVFKSMRMDKMNDNPINQRLLNHLAYAVAKDKEELEQFDKQSKDLRAKGLKMTESELYNLANLHGKIGTLTDKDIEDELSKYDSEEHPEYLKKLEKFTEEEFSKVAKEGVIDTAKSGAYFRKIKMKYGLQADSVLKELRSEERRKNKEYKDSSVEKLLSPSETEFKKEIDKKFESTNFTDEYNKRLKKIISDEYKKTNKYNKTDYVSREDLLDENQKILNRNKNLNKEAADKFQQKQSAAMDHLAGKPGRITLKDIQDYKDSLEKYKTQLTADETVPRSFLDQIDNKSNKDINAALDKISGTIMRREASLRVAANLYGLDGVNRAVQSVANAELITNYNNNKYFRKALLYFIKNGGSDDTQVEAALAYEKLKLSNRSLKEITDNFKQLALTNQVEGNIELINHLEEEIKISNDLLDYYEQYMKSEDAKDRAEDELTSSQGSNSSDEIVKKIKKEEIKFSEQEVQEAMNINELILKYGELVNKPKQSWKLYTNNSQSYRDDNLRELVYQGTIGVNNVVYFRPNESFDINEATSLLMNEKQLNLYKKGQELFNEDPTIIGNKDVMDISKFMVDGKLEFNDSDDAAIQFFAMSFVVNKEITNDISIPLPDGTKQIVRKKEDERVVSNSFLYSPYFAFDKTDENADAFVKKLNEDKVKFNGLTAELNNKKLTDIEKIQIKREADVLKVSITARELRANDATLYELRKQILLGSTIHKSSSEKNESYAMRALVKDFDYGPISEHTLNNEKLPQGEFNNFPLINVGDINSDNFDDNDNFLSDESTVEELFEQDKLALCYQDKSLIYLNSNKKVNFSQKESTEDTESLNEKGEAKEVELKENETTATPYTVGAMYYMHETKTGVLVPVKLNMQRIDSNKLVMDGLEKYINASIETIKSREKDQEKTLKIYDESISLEEGDFGGMFDNDPDAPKTLHKLLEYFLPHYNSKKDLDMPLMVYKTGDKGEVEDNTDMSSVSSESESGLSTDDVLARMTSETEEDTSKISTKSKAKKDNLHVDFGTQKRSIGEFNAEDLKAIMDNIGSMRFYFKKHLSINQSKPEGEKLIKPNVLSFAFTSGLITHGFDVKNNVEKIYSPLDYSTGIEKQVGLTINPMDSDVLGKTKRILKQEYNNKPGKQLFSPSLRNVFKFDTKFNKENKTPFDLKSINRQVKYLIDKRFKEISKEKGIDKTSTESERAEAYKEAVESRISMFKSELKLLEDKFGNTDRVNLFKLINSQVDKFDKQFKDKKNANIFKSIYMNRSQEEYFEELNHLLFTSNEINNELSNIMPDLKRPSANSPITFSSKEEGITKDKLKDIISAIEDNNELSLQYKSAGGNDFLPVDIEISSIERDKKIDKFKTVKERHTTYVDKEGTPKTKGQPAESIKIHSKDTFFYQDSNGKIAKLNTTDLDKFLKFDKNGKLTDGIVFLNLTGYKKGKFVALAVGTNTLKENKSSSVKDNGKNTFRYVSGINFHRHNKDLSINKKENNAIENVLSEKESAKDATPKLYAKLNPSKTAEDAFQEAYEEAMAAKEAAEEEAESVRQEYEDLKSRSKKQEFRSTKKKQQEPIEEESYEDAIRNAAIKSRGNQEDLRWITDELVPDIEDGGDLEKYSTELILDWGITDLKSAKTKDFTKMSDEEVFVFINEQPDGPGATKELFSEAMEIDPARTKRALNEIIKIIVKNSEPKKKSLTNIAAEEDENTGDMDISVKKQTKKEKVETSNKAATRDFFNESKVKQLKRVVLTGNSNVLKSIIDEAIDNNKGSTNLNNDIFVSAANAVSDSVDNKLPNNESIHMIAKTVFGDNYSKESTDSIIKEYNKNCKA